MLKYESFSSEFYASPDELEPTEHVAQMGSILGDGITNPKKCGY